MSFQHELLNAYIGAIWEVNANTLAYFPFTEDQLDHSGNWNTINKTLTKETIGYSTSNSGGNCGCNTITSNINFFWAWYKINSINTSTIVWMLSINHLWGTVYRPWHSSSSIRGKIQTYSWSGFTVVWETSWMSTSWWHYLAYSYYNGTLYLCKDGEVSSYYTWTLYDYWTSITLCQFGGWASANITFSEVIAESAWWDTEKMVDYYNRTKWNYS